MQKPYSILLYYCYTSIEHPESLRKSHHQYCLAKGLRGRVIIVHEGINGTISGKRDACAAYMQYLKQDTRFVNIHFKVTPHHDHVFKKLHVRTKAEIVHAGLPHIMPHKKTGTYLAPKTLQQMYNEEEVVLLDVRSNYEHKLGKFKGAITLDMDNFRAFPHKVASLSNLKNKKVITYCTGGVKCEKASAHLLDQGFKQVYQLRGGIIQYGMDTDGANFEGTCYVFDRRLTVPINTQNATLISRCELCHTACDRMVNCANPVCNKHVPICVSCAQAYLGACSKTCQRHPKKRPYNVTGYYTAQTRGYNPYQGASRNK